ncbi:MAG: 3-oxoacyl-[acyl-carrier protein] reductase [Clostridiales bacterium]|nr:3-oxoacyl-[acyl-carrier protein] reductase [Clostridiales bacterium]
MLESKVALVTGSGRGLGKAIAIKLAESGADLIINDLDEKSALETAEEIKKMGRKVLVSHGNVAVYSDMEVLFKDIQDTFGKLDILVNNAGITRDSLFLKMSEGQWDQVIAVNLKGIFNCTQFAVKMMAENNSGKIVSLSSVAGQMGNVGQTNYAATKAGVMGITKSLAKELARYNVNVNAIAPGIVQTPMTDVIPEKVMEGMLKQIPLRRIGQPDDIANLVRFLVSEDSAYITGQIIACNGGWYM